MHLLNLIESQLDLTSNAKFRFHITLTIPRTTAHSCIDRMVTKLSAINHVRFEFCSVFDRDCRCISLFWLLCNGNEHQVT
jgi:hypothetical protein